MDTKTMSLKILIITLFFIPIAGYSQNTDLKFDTLSIYKTITNEELNKNFEEITKTNEPNIVVAQEKSGSVYLLKKSEMDNWLAYSLYNCDNYEMHGAFLLYTFHSGGSSKNSTHSETSTVIVHIKTHSSTEISSAYEYQSWTDKRPVARTTTCSSNLTLNGLYLKVKYQCQIGHNKYTEPFNKTIAAKICAGPGGVYRYERGSFVKIKTYKPDMKGLQAVNSL